MVQNPAKHRYQMPKIKKFKESVFTDFGHWSCNLATSLECTILPKNGFGYFCMDFGRWFSDSYS